MSNKEGKEKVAAILVKRDGISHEDAMDQVNACVEELHEHVENGDIEGAYECIEYCLGLEPDYLDDLIEI